MPVLEEVAIVDCPTIFTDVETRSHLIDLEALNMTSSDILFL